MPIHDWRSKVAAVEAALVNASVADREIGRGILRDLKEWGPMYDAAFARWPDSVLHEGPAHVKWRIENASRVREWNQIAQEAETLNGGTFEATTSVTERLLRAQKLNIPSGLRSVIERALALGLLAEPSYYGPAFATKPFKNWPTRGTIESSLVDAMGAADAWIPLSGVAP